MAAWRFSPMSSTTREPGTELTALGAVGYSSSKESGNNDDGGMVHQGRSRQPLWLFRGAQTVDMLRRQTYYADELLRQRRAWARVPLFEKAVTPSDVGKLSRLVVPKKQAERHLPPVRGAAGGNGALLLDFVDGEGGKVWRFRYSYWVSSQSYVLSRGWIRFVREKGLRAGDIVAFSRWTFGPHEQLLIGCRKKKDAGTVAVQAPVVKLFGVDIAV
ncbi:unnamed protein product [Urochloa humidicola]